MNPKRRISERALLRVLGAVVLIALVYTGWSIIQAGRTAKVLSERTLENGQRLLRLQLAGSVQQVEQQLLQRASLLPEYPVGDPRSFAPALWRSLLAVQGGIRSARWADEMGNELALIYFDSVPVLRETVQGREPRTRLIPLELTADTSSLQAQRHKVDRPTHDPRTEAWYAKALEDARDAPVWHLQRSDQGASPVWQVAYLIRSRSTQGAFRVLMVELDPAHMHWVSSYDLPSDRMGALLLGDEGLVLDRSLPPQDSLLGQAMEQALDQWKGGQLRGSFPVQMEGRSYTALVSPYALHGHQLQTLAVMDTGPELALFLRERRSLIVLALLTSAMVVLMVMIAVRVREAEQLERRREQQSRSQELRLAKALGEREVLNREVHHRVKNNLQVVSSLLNLQASGLEDGPVRTEFLRGKQRIDTIALVHHKLYALKDLREVDLQRFLEDLSMALSDMYSNVSRTVSHEVKTHGLKCDQDTAIGLGIILCELMSNAYRHAFPFATGGHIDVEVMKVEGDLHRMVVKDNGKGSSTDLTKRTSGLGLEIVEAMAEQLDGSFHPRNGKGCTCEVLFRMSHSASSAAVNGEPDSL